MTDDRPRPRYGEYAPLPPAGALPAPAPSPLDAFPPPTPQRRPGDIAIATVLLIVGVVDVVTGFDQFADLAAVLRAAYVAQELGTFTSDALATAMGAAINVLRIVILAVTIGITLLFVRAGKRAFWIPLAGGAFAVLVVVVCVLVVITSDPALLVYVEQNSNP